MSDYPGAIWIPNQNFFPNTGKKSFIILHATAGGTSAEGIATYFKNTEGTNNPVSSHYIVGKDGHVVQTILEKHGSYANGVVNNSNWTGNPNNYTISIEFVKSSTDNSDQLTDAQKQAGFPLIKNICERNGIGKHDADDDTGITGHFAIDPVNRARCPGENFPWQELWNYLKGAPQPMAIQQPTANQIKSANDCWDSALKNTAAGPAPKGTGIYQSWLTALVQGRFYGPPITREYDSVDWSGNHIVVQEFARARCEWSGSPTWYTINGRL